MPVYNGARYLREAIDSVLAQDGVEFEFLIGDNASTDDSVSIIESYHDPRMRLIRQTKNRGIFGNLNVLCREARHDLVKIACCDDTILPGGLAKQRDFMGARPELAFSRCRSLSELHWWKTPSGRHEATLPEIIYPSATAVAHLAFGCIVGNLTNAIMRRSAYELVGGFREDLPYAGDFEFWARLSFVAAFGIDKRVLVNVRIHDNQSSANLNKQNELLWQFDFVMRDLIRRVNAKDRRLCRLHATLLYATAQMRHSVRIAQAGHWRSAIKGCMHREWAYPWPLIMIYLVFGYQWRLGHAWTSRRLVERIFFLNKRGEGASAEHA